MHFVEVCQHSYVHGQCKCPGPKAVLRVDCPTGQHGPEWLVWDEQQQRVRRQDERPPRNVALWLIGPDDAPEAVEIEQSDGQVYLLCKVSETDATFLGYAMATFARAESMPMYQSLTSRRKT